MTFLICGTPSRGCGTITKRNTVNDKNRDNICFKISSERSVKFDNYLHQLSYLEPLAPPT